MEPKLFLNRSDDAFEDKHLCNESANVSGMRSVTTTTYLLCIFVGSLSLLIMCGNLLVITSIIYFKQLHTPTNFLILSLAVSDLLVGVVVLPFSTMLAVNSCWYFQDLLCKLRSCFDLFLVACSIWNLCFISIDRYFAVCQPLRYRSIINVRGSVIMILITWIVSALLANSVTFLSVYQGHSNSRCVLFQDKSLANMGIVLGFYLPAIIMSLIYLKILIVAQRQARSIQNTTCQRTKSESKMERKATKTLAIVMGVFLISWSPFCLCMTFNPLTNFKIPTPLIASFKWLGWSNSMLNPFIYGFFYSWFRSAFRMIISGKIFHRDFTHFKLLTKATKC